MKRFWVGASDQDGGTWKWIDGTTTVKDETVEFFKTGSETGNGTGSGNGIGTETGNGKGTGNGIGTKTERKTGNGTGTGNGIGTETERNCAVMEMWQPGNIRSRDCYDERRFVCEYQKKVPFEFSKIEL